jgi:response regulator RpfG family c-di-GMP phosphodiesterase
MASRPRDLVQADAPRLDLQPRILVVDDEALTAEIVSSALALHGMGTAQCYTTADAVRALDQGGFDTVVTDLRMPDGDGRSLIAHARKSAMGPEVVVVTAAADVGTAVECMRLGAFDYLQKPFDLEVLVSVVGSAAQKHRAVVESRQLRRAFERSKYALMVALEARDSYTLGHCVNVARLARFLGEHIGAPRTILDAITNVGELHDVGKIGIPDAILNKDGPLTDAEQETMRFHPTIGLGIIDPLGTFPDEGALVVCHHERWNGGGYPQGLAGHDIPLVARITAICDVFDAVTTNRPYRTSLGFARGLEIIREGRGTEFEAPLVDEFLLFMESAFRGNAEEYARVMALHRQTRERP